MNRLLLNRVNGFAARWSAVVGVTLLLSFTCCSEFNRAVADDETIAPSAERGSPSAERGYRHLVDTAYVSPDLDNEVFDNIWRTWPEPLRKQAKQLDRLARRRMAFERYGLTPRPEHLATDQAYEKPLQYVVDQRGRWSPNCFSCHGGEVAGQVIPGRPNTRIALQTLAEEALQTRVLLGRTLSKKDLGLLFMPLGKTNGATNAVIFGIALLAIRDPDLTLRLDKKMPPLVHHDMDAPPWWHYRNKKNLYIDNFAPKGHRPLMQFMLVTSNGPSRFHQSEDDFRHIQAYLESLRPPKYPWPIDEPLAAQGRAVFQKTCAECHGNYAAERSYPERVVALDQVQTDPVRLQALSATNRQHYADSWFAEGHRDRVVTKPKGYVAPPLDGIWASAPYLHNGSVPTLWHLLHPDDRPRVWLASTDYDRARVGPQIESFDALPATARDSREARRYYDTERFGMSAGGHRFPDVLTEPQRAAVLEYLKTL